MELLKSSGRGDGVEGLSGGLQAALLVAVVQFEPGLLGYNYGSAHLLLVWGLLAALLVVEKISPVAVLETASRRPEILIFALYFTVIMAKDFSVSPHLVLMSGGFLGKGLVGLAAIVVLASVMPFRRQMLVLSMFFGLQGASYAVSSVAQFMGVLDSLYICDYGIKGYEGDQRLYAPWSLYYQQSYSIAGGVYPRAVGFYREPGNFQAFAATALVGSLMLRRWVLAALILIGLVASLSSAALLTVIALVGWGVILAVKSRRAIGLLVGAGTIVALVAIIPFFYGLESVGFKDKLANESGQDRIAGASAGMDVFLARPWFGVGMLNEESFRVGPHGINLLAGLGAVGLVGMALLFSAVILALVRNHSVRSLTLCLPILITMITSQPLYFGLFMPWIVCLPVTTLGRRRAFVYGCRSEWDGGRQKFFFRPGLPGGSVAQVGRIEDIDGDMIIIEDESKDEVKVRLVGLPVEADLDDLLVVEGGDVSDDEPDGRRSSR